MSKLRELFNVPFLFAGVLFMVVALVFGIQGNLWFMAVWLLIGFSFIAMPPTVGQSKVRFKPLSEYTPREWLATGLVVAALITFITFLVLEVINR